MTPQARLEACAEATKAHLERLRAAGQGEHADALRKTMWVILGPFLANSRGH